MKQRREGEIIKTPQPEKSKLNPQANDGIWISYYAEHPITSVNTEHIESWADCVAAYVNEPEWFHKNYPNTYDYIKEMFTTYKRTTRKL